MESKFSYSHISFLAVCLKELYKSGYRSLCGGDTGRVTFRPIAISGKSEY